MKFLIITHVDHIENNNQYFGYAPYVREINGWLKYVDEVVVVGSLLERNATAIDISYDHDKTHFIKISNISFTSLRNCLLSGLKLPVIFWKIFWAMKSADHIHLRCPGNIGLIGCFVQILFPNKIKTAKYAGNWDPNSQQPWTYRLQKRILRNSFLTHNMQVLVYGDWKNKSRNVKPFFTATYSDTEKEIISKTGFDKTIEFVFMGSLVSGKNPMYAIKLIEELINKNHNAVLNLYGDGIEKDVLMSYIKEKRLEKNIFLHGNQNKEIIKTAYQNSHFVLLPSKSEGWPKAIAEGMFWGCVPLSTKVSCVPFMLDNGNRGVLLEMNIEVDSAKIMELIQDENVFMNKSRLAAEWSQKYTTDVFESEIKKLLVK